MNDIPPPDAESTEGLRFMEHDGQWWASNRYWMVRASASEEAPPAPERLEASPAPTGPMVPLTVDKIRGNPVAIRPRGGRWCAVLDRPDGDYVFLQLQYLAAAVPGWDAGKCTIEQEEEGPDKPVYFRADGRLVAVIMPMRVFDA